MRAIKSPSTFPGQDHLSDLGRREDALAAGEKAVALRRRLAAARRDAFTPDLAGSLNNLASFLSALGRREDALAVAEEAVALLSPFFVARPEAFAQWMQEMVRVYREACTALRREPSTGLLSPVVETFSRLKPGQGANE